MNTEYFKNIRRELESLRSQYLYRNLRSIKHTNPVAGIINKVEYTLFCSNDYLGLSWEPKMIEASIDATKKYGVGAGASRLISGNLDLYEELEISLAGFKGTESALVFSSGYLANLGIITSLVGSSDLVAMDRLCHSSIVDACKLSGAKVAVFQHLDPNALDILLKKRRHLYKNTLVITEGVFSMDGDIPNLNDFLRVSDDHNCILLVDDAHAMGFLGKTGAGSAEHFNIEPNRLLLMGTLSKSVGCLGGFVAASSEIIQFIINKGRSFIYTTALPPGMLAAANIGISMIKQARDKRDLLLKYCNIVRNELNKYAFPIGKDATPIIPIILGSNSNAIKGFEFLMSNRLFAPAIRPPTVPKGLSRLRLSLSSAHTEENIKSLLDCIPELSKILKG